MSLEIECKFCDVDFAPLREKLSSNTDAMDCGVHFEQNTLFETNPPSLSKRHMLLRLRVIQERGSQQKAFVTLKMPCRKRATKDLKVLDEREVTVSNPQEFRSILNGLGFKAFAAYEKVRESWVYHGVEISFDILPFGNFVELEGAQTDIEEVIHELGLEEYQRSTLSYHALHKKYAKQSKETACDRSFTFEADERKRWCEELGIPCVAAVNLNKT